MRRRLWQIRPCRSSRWALCPRAGRGRGLASAWRWRQVWWQSLRRGQMLRLRCRRWGWRWGGGLGWKLLFTGAGWANRPPPACGTVCGHRAVGGRGSAAADHRAALGSFGIGVGARGPLPAPPAEAKRVLDACLAALANQARTADQRRCGAQAAGCRCGGGAAWDVSALAGRAIVSGRQARPAGVARRSCANGPRRRRKSTRPTRCLIG